MEIKLTEEEIKRYKELSNIPYRQKGEAFDNWIGEISDPYTHGYCEGMLSEKNENDWDYAEACEDMSWIVEKAIKNGF